MEWVEAARRVDGFFAPLSFLVALAVHLALALLHRLIDRELWQFQGASRATPYFWRTEPSRCAIRSSGSRPDLPFALR